MNTPKLIQGNIKKQIISLSIPMIFGTLGMMIFNIIDSYFIGQLGVDQLAAICFTFPVVMFVGSISFGIGIAVSTILSKIVGEGKQDKAQRFTTDSLGFAFITAIIVAIIGELTIEPLFQLLGAKASVMPHIIDYMRYWYLGIAFVTIPMVGNNAIRACGDTFLPAIIMSVSAISNIILDPIFIFGKFGAPEMGIAGAALATVISRAIGLLVSLLVLNYKYRLIGITGFSFKSLYENWKELLFIGIPSATTKVVMPLGSAFITSILATYGNEIVAGYGIAIKVEGLAVVVLISICSVISPFAGQNIGAGKFDRVEEGISFSVKLCIGVSLVILVILWQFGIPISSIFVNDTQNLMATSRVITTSALYLKVVPPSFAFIALLTISGTILNVLRKPVLAAFLTALQMFGLYLPLALIAHKYFGITQIFLALVVSYLITGILSYFFMKKHLRKAKLNYLSQLQTVTA